VPYRGAPLAMNDVLSGRANFMSGDLATVTPMVSAGRLRALAVTEPKRVTSLPDAPTVAETLPGFEATGWFAMFAPKSTHPAHAERTTRRVRDSQVAHGHHRQQGHARR
jgi:tripartite-type tricarboxylate transporter receptor subunit TctC